MRTKHLVRRIDDVDLISSLPAQVCNLIVSFLPTKEAVKTSVLSKRWRYVYASSPSLDFDFSLFPRTRGRRQAFTDFVACTLALFSGLGLRSFRLSMVDYGPGHEPRIDDWVGFAAAHEVQQLDLGLPKGKQSKIPDCVFQCGSLVDLKLRMCEYSFDLPSPAGLKKLRSLFVKSFSMMKGRFFKEVFANCLVLEEIVIEECMIDVLEIEGERIRRLRICNCDWPSPGRIRVSAPRLRGFEYVGTVAGEHWLENLMSLDEAVLNLRAPLDDRSDESCRSLLIRLVQMVGNARALTLSPWCIEVLSRVQSLPKYMKPQGENLKDLVLFLGRKEDCVQVVSPLLVSCVHMENLSVCIVPTQSKRRGLFCDDEHKAERKPNIKGAMKRLKTVELEYIDENRTGLELVKFLLENVRSLEKMTIVQSEDGLEHAKYRRKVSTFRKTAKNAKIVYCVSD